MTYRPALVFALALMPAASAAQLSDAGVSTTLGYRQHLDVLRRCCPPPAPEARPPEGRAGRLTAPRHLRRKLRHRGVTRSHHASRITGWRDRP